MHTNTRCYVYAHVRVYNMMNVGILVVYYGMWYVRTYVCTYEFQASFDEILPDGETGVFE